MKTSQYLTRIFVLALAIVCLYSCSKGEKHIVTKFSDGKPAIIHYIKNGQKVFEERYYPNGQMRSEGKWDGKQRSGEWKFYFDDGVLFAKADFTNKKEGSNWQIWQGKDNQIIGKKDSIISMAFSNEGTIVTLSVKRGNGEVFYRFFNSFHLMEKVNLKGNIPQGQAMTWFENGAINSETYYKDGIKDSIYVVYAESGQKIVSGQYKKGTKVGKWEFYSSNGKPQGMEIYDMDGTILKENTNSGLIYHHQPLSTIDSTSKK